MEWVDRVNDSLKDQPPLKVAAVSVAVTLGLKMVYNQIFTVDMGERFERMGISIARKLIPSVRAEIEEKLGGADREMRKSYKRYEGEILRSALPKIGLGKEGVLAECTRHLSLDSTWEEGEVSGGIYHGGTEITEVLSKVYTMFHWTNPLHADLFVSIKKMESEVVAMVLDMFNAPKGAAGTMTTGGTESILMAMKTYRDWGLRERRITNPNIVVADSAHAAFDKACNYFRIEIIRVDCDPATGRADVAAMKRATNRNTVCMVGSAPSFGVGCIDPIKELAPWCKSKGICFHVDSCLGGFVVPFMREAGFSLPDFDFTVAGVTSISADTHKYGFAPKGSSTVLYRTEELRAFQYFVQPRWPGGIYASPTFSGSRSGALVAATWAALTYMGRDGYVNIVRELVTATQKIRAGVGAVKGLRLMGPSDTTVVAFTSDKFDIFQLSTRLHKRGWVLNGLQRPSAIHICCTRLHTKEGVAERFVKDVEECTAEIMALDVLPTLEGFAAMYGTAAQVPPSLVKEFGRLYFDAYYTVQFDHEKTDNEGRIILDKKEE